MPKHIVIVVDSIDIDDSSGSKANVALIKSLIKLGYKVSVYHYTRKQIEIEKATCQVIKEKNNNLLYVLSRLQRVFQRTFKINLAKYLEPLFGFSFTFFNDVNSIKAELEKIDISKVNLILTLSKAASFRPHYAVNKSPKFHDKWMAYIHDPYPFSCYPKPYDWKEPGSKIKEQFFLDISSNAKYSAFPSLLLKEFMGETFKNFKKTGIIIPHQIIDIDLKGHKAQSYFDSNKFNVLHAGSLLKQRNPEGLIKGFQLFLDKNIKAKEHTKLILLGSADYHKKMIENYSKKLPQLHIDLSHISFKDVYWLQNHVSVNVILEADSEISPFLPGKFPHCVSANKPIFHLGPKNSETFRLLGGNYLHHSSIDDVNNIAYCIGQLYNLWLKNGDKLELNRQDLEYYISADYLEKVLLKVI
ncbi:glycosyltransferase family protein [Changchengzhania lutea]|uniref:glycosyltransferase family 4 protein n=1 Tax=Changchengzhania lutea TaxID=2049305 RepID=UPI00115E3476|nr:glycosyltransferase family 4 protein [Changchengzhania lutea]